MLCLQLLLIASSTTSALSIRERLRPVLDAPANGDADRATTDAVKAMSTRFLARFDRMVADNHDLSADDLQQFRKELRDHSAQRLRLMQTKKAILAQHADPASAAAQEELGPVMVQLRQLGERHQEIFRAAGGPDSAARQRPTGQHRQPPAATGQAAPNVAEAAERRRKAISDRSDMLWQQAKVAGFESAELQAIKDELDDFTAQEYGIIDQMVKVGHWNDAQAEDQKEKRISLRDDLRAIFAERKKLTDRINRQKEL